MKTVQVDTPNPEAIENASKCAALIEKLTEHLETMNTDYTTGNEFFLFHYPNTQLSSGLGDYADIYRKYREKWSECYTTMSENTVTMLGNLQKKIEEIQEAMAKYEAASHTYTYKEVEDSYICGENETVVGG
jgi:hypothetical protein